MALWPWTPLAAKTMEGDEYVTQVRTVNSVLHIISTEQVKSTKKQYNAAVSLERLRLIK